MTEPFITRLLRPEQVLLNLRSQDRDAVIRELVRGVHGLAPESPEAEAFCAAVLERERIHSTGIGDGIALPHARNQQPALLPSPILVFGRHQQGIHFAAVDNRPVDLFFLLSAPSLTQHLKMLAVLSRLLRNHSLREALRKTDSPSRVIQLLVEGEQNMAR